MTPLHDEHATVVALSNVWFERDPQLWYVGLELSKALDRTLLASIYQRLREVRDQVAREAFERRVSIGEVARERRAALAARSGNEGTASTGGEVVDFIQMRNVKTSPPAGCA